MFGVRTETLAKRGLNAEIGSALRSVWPAEDLRTGSKMISPVKSLRILVKVVMISALAVIPILMWLGFMSSKTDDIWSATSLAGRGWQWLTPMVFWQVMAVMAAAP